MVISIAYQLRQHNGCQDSPDWSGDYHRIHISGYQGSIDMSPPYSLVQCILFVCMRFLLLSCSIILVLVRIVTSYSEKEPMTAGSGCN